MMPKTGGTSGLRFAYHKKKINGRPPLSKIMIDMLKYEEVYPGDAKHTNC